MGQKINTLKPDKPISGASLMQESVAGRKTQFLLQSTTASGSFSVPAGGTHSLTVDLDLFPNSIPSANWGVNNLISWDENLAWAYCDFYIDTLDAAHYYPTGASLTVAQLKVIFSKVDEISPDIYSGTTPASGTTSFNFYNADASPHTVYAFVTYKYLVIGGSDL